MFQGVAIIQKVADFRNHLGEECPYPELPE